LFFVAGKGANALSLSLSPKSRDVAGASASPSRN